MLAAFVVVMLGFWPTFYRPLSGGSTLRTVHGVTSTLWYLALVVQPWLVTHGYVRWHKRVAVAVIALLPVLCVSALMTTRVMLARSTIPAMSRPLIPWRSSRTWRFSSSCSPCRPRRGGSHSVSGSPQVRWVARHSPIGLARQAAVI
jgi:hypothetical protein